MEWEEWVEWVEWVDAENGWSVTSGVLPKKFHAATLHFLVDTATSAKKTRVICCPGGNRNQATVT